MKKRIVCLMLAVMMMGTQVATVSASREEELREEQAWTSAQLDATYSQQPRNSFRTKSLHWTRIL